MEQKISLTSNDAWIIVGEVKRLALTRGIDVSACVVGRYKNLLLEFNMDDARISTNTVAYLKAMQSAHTGKTTRIVRDLVNNKEATPTVLGINPEEFVYYAGGIPLYKNINGKDVRHGALGISNLVEDEDEELAMEVADLTGYYYHLST